jgi:formylglycine-generating enzyme required for sulfatase activity
MLLACDPQPAAPVAVSGEVDGMVPIPAGEVMLGPNHLHPLGGPPPGSGPPPGGRPPGPPPGASAPDRGAPRPADHAAGGAERQAGGPPPIGAQPGQTPVPANPQPYQSFGGQQVERKRVQVAAFWMDRTEVTRAQFKSFLDATGYKPPYVMESWADEQGWNWTETNPPPGTEDHPVVLVNYYDAEEYCLWAGKRLPSEAEWQLAALGPANEGRVFPWGADYDGARLNHGKMDQPNFDDSDGYLYTSPVGAFPSGRGPYGLDDAFGNAWEFTSDLRVDAWSQYQSDGQEPKSAVRAPMPGLYIAVRGGAYFFDLAFNPGGERNEFLPELRRKSSGFRCAR